MSFPELLKAKKKVIDLGGDFRLKDVRHIKNTTSASTSRPNVVRIGLRLAGMEP